MDINVTNHLIAQGTSFLGNMTSIIASQNPYYLFITDGKEHWVYYLTVDQANKHKVAHFIIPYYDVHWKNDTVALDYYNLNKSIDGEGMDNGEQFVEDYINFYNHILHNLTRFKLLSPPVDVFQTYQGVEKYKNKCKEFILNAYTISGAINENGNSYLAKYFIDIKQQLYKIINDISRHYMRENNQMTIPAWYTDSIKEIQQDEPPQSSNDADMEVEQSPQAAQPAQNQTINAPQAAQPAQNQGTVNGSSSSSNSGSNINPPSVPASNPSNPPTNRPSNPPTNRPTDRIILNSTAQDVHGLMSSHLHDMLHDYAFTPDSKRTSGLDIFVKDVRDKLGRNIWVEYDNFDYKNFTLTERTATQAGGVLVDALRRDNTKSRHIDMPHEPVDPNEKKKQKIIASIKEIETTHRPFLNTLYMYLYSWFVAHLYNDDTVDFDLQPNLDLFMTMTGATNSKATIVSKVHNYFVQECFFNFEKKYEKTKNFIKFYENISKTDSKTVTGENTLVEYFVLNKQSGGGAKKGKGKGRAVSSVPPLSEAEKTARHKGSYGLLLTIAESFKTRYIPDYPKTYNHFLRAQQDVLNIVFEDKNLPSFDPDAAILRQAIDIIALNTRDDEKHTPNVNSTVLNDIHTAGPQNEAYIIDNSMLNKSFFKNKIICCQSTMDDGVAVFGSHACKGENAVDSQSNMNVKIFCNNDLYIEYIRDDMSWRVTWQSNGNNFTYALARTNTLVAEDRFTAAIGNLVKKWSTIQNEPSSKESRHALSDAMYEHIIFKSMGDILQELNGVLKNGGYVSTPDYANTNVVTYNNGGDALRLVVSNDRPSASRILWYLYNGANLGSGCNNESSDWTSWINQYASGGFLTTNDGCFIYNPGKTNVVPNSSTIYRNEHEDYPLIPFTKENIFIGKKLLNNNHYYNNGILENFTVTVKNPDENYRPLYQAYFIHNNDEKVYLNSLKFYSPKITSNRVKYTLRAYSPIILNVINEKLLHTSMTVTNFETKINSDEYAYDPNHGFMSIDIINQNNYFYYTTANNSYINDASDGDINEFKIFKKLINHKKSTTCYQKFLPPVYKPNDDKNWIIQLALPRNKSVQVLNSEAYLYDTIHAKLINYNDAYSLVVYLHDENVNTNTNDQTIIPPITACTNLQAAQAAQAAKAAKAAQAAQAAQLQNNDMITDDQTAQPSNNSMITDNQTLTSVVPDFVHTTSNNDMKDITFRGSNSKRTLQQKVQQRNGNPAKIAKATVFTIRQIKDALKPAAGLKYETEKKKFVKINSDMTFEQIKNVTLHKDVDEKRFHNNLLNPPSSSMQGGAVDPVDPVPEPMDPLLYAVTSIGVLVLVLTGLKM